MAETLSVKKEVKEERPLVNVNVRVGSTDNKITLNGVPYFDGQTYTVTEETAIDLMWIMHNTQEYDHVMNTGNIAGNVLSKNKRRF